MPKRETSDAELARKCRGGDPDAWRQLVRRHTDWVYRLAVRMLRSSSGAEDACQETFLRVHRSIESFDATRPLKPWISRIAYNVCLRRLGKVSRGKVDVVEPEELEHVEDVRGPGPEERTAKGEVGAMLTSALDHLSAENRAIVVMRYRDGLSLAEVAEATGMPVNTVKTRLFRARGSLREVLEPLLEES